MMDNENMNPQNNQQNANDQQPYQQQPYQQQPYQQQPYQPYQPPQRNPQDGRGFSIASLVIGCCSIVFCWTPALNLILLACGIIAVIMGTMGRKKSIMAYGKASGLATAGLVLGIIGTAITGIGAVSCIACLGCSSCGAMAGDSLVSSIF